MNNMYSEINEYYKAFESYQGVIDFKSLKFLLSLVSAALFVYGVYWSMYGGAWPVFYFHENVRFFMVMPFGMMVVLYWLHLEKIKNKLVISRVRAELKTKENNINTLKGMWLEWKVDKPACKYLSIAEDIDNILILEEKHRSDLYLTKKKLYDMFFSAESKPRVLILFMGISAAVIALSIASGSNIETIFIFYRDVSILQFLGMVVFVAFYVFVLWVVIKYICLIAVLGVEMWVDNYDGINSASKRRAGIFIIQLLRFHELEKRKDRGCISKYY